MIPNDLEQEVEDAMPFSRKLFRLRTQRGWTQQEMARMIGIDAAQIQSYETGNASPTLEVIRSMARALNVSADELVFDERERAIFKNFSDQRLLNLFRRISRMSPDEQAAFCAFLEKVDIKNYRFDGVYKPNDDEWSRDMREVMAAFRRGAEDFSDNEIDAIVDEAVGAVRQTG